MSYNKEDLKRIGLRIAKNINHDLQRSKMNSYLKPYFTESSVQFIDKDNQSGIVLNTKSIDIKDSLDEMEEVRFFNNMRLLQETVNRYLKKEKVDSLFELKSYSENSDLTKLGNRYTSQYKNFMLSIKNEDADVVLIPNGENDGERDEFVMRDYGNNSYEVSADNQGNAITNDLRHEIDNNDPLKVLADPNKGKLAVANSSHYNDMIIDTGVGRDM